MTMTTEQLDARVREVYITAAAQLGPDLHGGGIVDLCVDNIVGASRANICRALANTGVGLVVARAQVLLSVLNQVRGNLASLDVTGLPKNANDSRFNSALLRACAITRSDVLESMSKLGPEPASQASHVPLIESPNSQAEQTTESPAKCQVSTERRRDSGWVRVPDGSMAWMPTSTAPEIGPAVRWALENGFYAVRCGSCEVVTAFKNGHLLPPRCPACRKMTEWRPVPLEPKEAPKDAATQEAQASYRQGDASPVTLWGWDAINFSEKHHKPMNVRFPDGIRNITYRSFEAHGVCATNWRNVWLTVHPEDAHFLVAREIADRHKAPGGLDHKVD